MYRSYKFSNLGKWFTILNLVVVSLLAIGISRVQAEEVDYEESEFIQYLDHHSLATTNRSFLEYVPYVQYNNYQYSGYESDFTAMYSLLEYSPNEAGIFQVAMLFDGQTLTTIFQIRNEGLYELANFSDYGEVRDLRAEPAVSDAQESLLLPSTLSKGQTYTSGYNNEYVRTIQAILPHWERDDLQFSDVLVIQETGYPGGASWWYYFAPTYGIICSEFRDAEGELISEERLNKVFNNTD